MAFNLGKGGRGRGHRRTPPCARRTVGRAQQPLSTPRAPSRI
ncbi:hypothetical protein BRPE64_ACDS26930 [Caballeronia insecticola]|uniref:Uncharacterized protein n=1 Tax=Caballeronia insecticola TaxID=758793 RepID=R4X0J1_9BURK|nr:hypothetical protein BRPE64_ACDS26930 [Caballeronia insecticola]